MHSASQLWTTITLTTFSTCDGTEESGNGDRGWRSSCLDFFIPLKGCRGIGAIAWKWVSKRDLPFTLLGVLSRRLSHPVEERGHPCLGAGCGH